MRQGRRRILFLAIGFLAGRFCWAQGEGSGGGGSKGANPPEEAAMSKAAIGFPVPDFTLKDSEGNEVTFSAYRGENVAVITFLSKACPVSRALHPTIARFARDYGEKGVKFLGIMSNSTEKTPEVARALREQGITFPILDDLENRIADSLAAEGTPHMYIVDKDGHLRYSGAVCDDWKNVAKAEKHFFKNALDAVLAGKKVQDPYPGAFIGCSIKRAKTAG